MYAAVCSRRAALYSRCAGSRGTAALARLDFKAYECPPSRADALYSRALAAAESASGAGGAKVDLRYTSCGHGARPGGAPGRPSVALVLHLVLVPAAPDEIGLIPTSLLPAAK
jgi:hypothetical protein